MKHVRSDDGLLQAEPQGKRATTDKDHICCFGMVSFNIPTEHTFPDHRLWLQMSCFAHRKSIDYHVAI